MPVKTKIRKNFIFEKDIAKDLEYIAKEMNLSQTATIKSLIEEKKADLDVERKLEIAKRVIGGSDGLFVGKSIQSIKAEMDV